MRSWMFLMLLKIWAEKTVKIQLRFRFNKVQLFINILVGLIIGISWSVYSNLSISYCPLAGRRRRRKGNPVPGGITGPPCHLGHKYKDVVLQVGCWSEGLRTFLCKKKLSRKRKKWKPDAIWHNPLRTAKAQKELFSQWWWWWWWWY
jgi:hypothetical protein